MKKLMLTMYLFLKRPTSNDLNLSALPPISELENITLDEINSDSDPEPTLPPANTIFQDSPVPAQNQTLPDITTENSPIRSRNLNLQNSILLQENEDLNPLPEINIQKPRTRKEFWGIHPANIIAPSENSRNITLRRSIRNSQKQKNIPNAFSASLDNPISLKACQKRDDWNKWKNAIETELDSLKKLNTWTLVDRPPNTNIVGNKFVFKNKRNSDGTIDKYKARLVAKGYTQQEGVDFFSTTSPVAKFNSLKTVLSIAAINDYEIDQMDVSTAFLVPELKEDIFMEQPKGFEKLGQENKVCKLNKSLYGLKQASHEWNKNFNKTLLDLKFTALKTDPCIYVRNEENEEKFYIVLYVDDFLLICKNRESLNLVKNQLSSKYDLHDLGPVEQFLNMVITRNRKYRTIHLSQIMQIQNVLELTAMENCVPVHHPFCSSLVLNSTQSPSTEKEKLEMKNIPYRETVGSLMYIACNTRPDIMAATSFVSRYVSNPGLEHWTAVKRILRYLKGTEDLGLVLGGSTSVSLHGYSDADWGGDRDTRKSTTGYVFFIGNGCVSWQTKKQPTTALSTTEAEYLSLSTASQEMLWLRQLLEELGYSQKTTTIQQDNTGCIQLSENNKHHQRTKHIDIRHHFIKDLVLNDVLKLVFCNSENMVADLFTKSLPRTTFEKLCAKLNVFTVADFRARAAVEDCSYSANYINLQSFVYLS